MFILNNIFYTRCFNQSKSLIDHIISNFLINGAIYNIDNSISDHNILLLEYDNKIRELYNNKREAPTMSLKINYNHLLNSIKNIKLLPIDDIKKCFNEFINQIKITISKTKYKSYNKISDKKKS